MLAKLRRTYAQPVTLGAQLILLLVGFQLQSRKGWLVCLTLMASLSIIAWLSALKRLRAVRDTPTSKIASAAQGYVELAGYGQPFGETPLLGKLSKLPCLWFRYQVEQRNSENNWETLERGESSDSFLLRDDTGLCIVDPEQAEIFTRHRKQWDEADKRYTEWNLFADEKLYAIGDFRTQGGSNAASNTREELNALLAAWKKDMPALHQRFDLDNNGTLDMREWMLAKSAAKREIGKRRQESQALPGLHIISKSRDGKLFLISNLEQHDLSRRYLFWTWLHLIIFTADLGAIAWLSAF
jgi:hypothetical protein